MFAIWILFGFFTFIYSLYYYFTRTFNYWKNQNVPGPKPVILFGNTKESVLRREANAISTKRIHDAFPNEKVVGIYRMTTPNLLIRDLDLIKDVMIKDFDSFEDRGVEFSKENLGANLFHADGDSWRVLRHRFTPLFTTGKLKNMLYLITDRGDKFLDHIGSITAVEKNQQVHNLMKMYTLSTIAACAFGIDVDPQSDDSFIKSLDKMDKLIFSRNVIQDLDIMFPTFLRTFNMSFFPRDMIKFFENLVVNMIKQRNGMPSGRKDFMDLILALRQEGEIQGPKKTNDSKDLSLEITNDIIAAQAFIFYAAGYETSATTMSFLLYELAMNPHVQEKLIKEVDEVLKKHNNTITYETLNELPYMEKVFDETLRKYPLVDPLQRKAKHDYKVPGTNATIKKDQLVLVSVLGIHYDKNLYPKPEVFDPERFDPKMVANRHSCAYLPFGVGPRNCIGMRFAKVQSRACILKLLSRFRVEATENMKAMEFDANRVIISPPQGFTLKITARDKRN